ncbi:MAG: cobalt ECF transporter T component CbiQ [Methermicoccaceae archaeon]
MEYPEIDRYASYASPVHQLDPRAKILAFLCLIFSVVLVNEVEVAFLALLFSLSLLIASRLPLRFAFQHIRWVFIFVLPFLVLMPFTVAGRELMSVYGITMTYEGVMYAVLITLRALAAVVLAFIMLATTRFNTTIKALHMLKVPNPLVQMLMFTYRYIFVLLDEFLRMWRAMTAKGFTLKTSTYAFLTVGTAVGMLIVKSYERAERVYQAMQSRGYTGNPKTLVEFRMKTKDYVLASFLIGFAALLHTYLLVM